MYNFYHEIHNDSVIDDVGHQRSNVTIDTNEDFKLCLDFLEKSGRNLSQAVSCSSYRPRKWKMLK